MNNRADAEADEILPNGHIMRYPFRERLMHWINGFAYLYLMLTGLAFCVALATVDCRGPGRNANFAHAASVGRPRFCFQPYLDVHHLGCADAHHRSR